MIESFIIIIIINPLTVRVVGAPQMILQPVFSSFPCSPLPSGTWRTQGQSISLMLPSHLFLCLPCTFGVRSTSVLPQWHVKDPGHSANSAGGWLHLNVHTPMTQWSWSGLNMPLSRYSVGTYQPIRKRAHTQLVREHSVTVVSLWTDPGLKSGISVRKLISTYKKKIEKKSVGREWIVEHSPKILAGGGKAPTPCGTGTGRPRAATTRPPAVCWVGEELEHGLSRREVHHSATLSVTRARKVLQYSYRLRGHTHETTDSAKYLGVAIKKDLSWNTHIENICARASETLGFLRRNLKIGSTSIKHIA